MIEKEIVQGAIEGREEAQREVFQKWAGNIKATILRYINDDAKSNKLLMEVFVDCFGSLEKGEYSWNVPFPVWLRARAVNRCMKEIRKSWIMKRFSNNPRSYVMKDVEDLDLAKMPGLTSEHMFRTLTSLSDPHRIFFNMYVIDGYGYAEIAERLRIREATVERGVKESRNAMMYELLQIM